MDWQSLLDGTDSHETRSQTSDGATHLMGAAVIVGVMALGVLAAMIL